MKSDHSTPKVAFCVSELLFAFLVAGLIINSPALAQSVTGGIQGVVFDPTGSVVPGVTVTVINLATNETRQQTTDDKGAYNFVSLHPAEYRLEAEIPGFRKLIRGPIEVLVNKFVKLDLTLEIGELSQTVEVTGAAPLLEATTSSLGHVVETRQVVDLPLNGRNTIALAVLAPGIRPQGTFGENPATVNYTGWGNFSANGGIANANEVLVDGAPVTHSELNGVIYMPPVDGTQEFKVQTNNYSAEFGRSSGGLINLSMKSGSNEIHGTAYEFFRNKSLDANDFFLNRAGKPKPFLTYNQFGATFGGPIARDRSFIFGLYEGFRQHEGRALTTTVPMSAQRAGDFSQTFNANGQLIQIFDPLTSRPAPDGKGFTRDSFPGNIIPKDRINPVAVKLVNRIWPLPNTTGRPFTNVNNFSTSATQPTDEDQFTVKSDHSFSDKHKLSTSYSYAFFDLGGFDPLRNKTTTTDVGRSEKNRSQHVVITDDYIFSPNTIVELRASYLRFRSNRIPPSTGQDLTEFGFPKALADAAQFKTFPVIRVSGVQPLDSSTSSTILRVSNAYSYGGSLSLIRGKHSMKVGMQFRALQLNDVQLNNGSPNLFFDEGFTRADPFKASATAGVGMASFLLGYPSGGNIGRAERLSNQNKYTAWYFQDDWKTTAKLTLNLGLRYEIEPFLTERFNRLAHFDFKVVPEKAAAFTGLPLRGGLAFQNPNDRSPSDTFYKQLGPRLGFAYQILPKTVIRGGYGMFWLPNNLATPNSGINNSAYSFSTPFVSSIDGGVTPFHTLGDPFPNGVLLPPGSAAGADTLIGQGVSVWLKDNHPAYTQQWNLNIQQEIGSGMAVDIAYAGSKSTHLPASVQFDQLPDEFLSLGPKLNEQVPNPFFGFVKTGPLSAKTVASGQLLRPYPQFTSVFSSWGEPIGSSIYHSMQLKISRRFSRGALIAASYTFSKVIGDTESITGWLEPNGQPSGFQNNNNRRLDRSLGVFDTPHRLVVYYNYEFPVGRRQQFLNNFGGVTNWIVSGWQVNGITMLQSGTPLVMNTSTNLTNSFGGGSRPNISGDPTLHGPKSSRLNRWFDTGKFSQPPAFTFGNTPRTLSKTRGDGIINFDFSVFKNNWIGERYNVQFRAEFFDLFNHVQFGMPDRTVGSPQFGIVSSQANKPRQIQFALKLIY